MTGCEPSCWNIRHLPLAARLTISLFLVSVGLGYLAGLVQLHFAHAKSGELLPTGQDALDLYHGAAGQPQSKMEKLLLAPETAPFNGNGTMRPAFFDKSSGWKRLISKRPEKEIREERETEIQALLVWLRHGAPKGPFEQDQWPMPPELQKLKWSDEFIVTEDKSQFIKLRSLFEERCTRCHRQGGADAKAEKFVLETYEQLEPHVLPQASQAMSLAKLAMTTHAHWLSFAVLFGLTGLLFSLTCYPCWLKVLLAPLTLLAQMVDISFWWLARVHAVFAHPGILISGAIVGISLGLQIILTLFSLYGKKGKAVLVLLLLIAGFGGFMAKQFVIDPYITDKAAKAQK